MTVNKRVGYGVTLGVDVAGGTSYVALAAVIDGCIDTGAKADIVDTTLLSEAYKTKGKAAVDPGEKNFTIAYDPDDTVTTLALTGLLAPSATLPHWEITYGSGSTGAGTNTTEKFFGWVSGFKKTVEKDKYVVAELTIAISGNPGYQGA